MQPTLDNLKRNVYADDLDYDDELLDNILSSAIDHVINYTQRSEEDLIALGGGQWPPSLGWAVIALASHWYNQREAVSQGTMARVPAHYEAALRPFRKLGKTTCD